MIRYSVTLIGNPRDPSQPKKAHARVQTNTHYSLHELADHIAKHNSKYTRGDIYAVLEAVARHVKELVLMGNKVSLGDLGAFYPTINSSGADSLANFGPENIRSLRVKWDPPKEFEDLKEEATFERVTKLATRRQLLRDENQQAAESKAEE